MAFRGVHPHAIDPKGRTSLPARFRQALAAQKGKSLVVTQHPWDACLLAYAPLEWKRIEERIAALPRFDEEVIQFSRIFVAFAEEVDIDGMGRVLIPPALREFAALEKEVVWVGQVQSIQLWSQERWNKAQAAARAEISKGPVAARLRQLF